MSIETKKRNPFLNDPDVKETAETLTKVSLYITINVQLGNINIASSELKHMFQTDFFPSSTVAEKTDMSQFKLR